MSGSEWLFIIGPVCVAQMMMMLALVFCGLVFAMGRSQKRDMHEGWFEMAEVLNLVPEPAKDLWGRPAIGSMVGHRDGFVVKVEMFVQSRGEMRTIVETFFQAPLGLGLDVTSAGASSKGIQVGDEAFDSRLMIKGRDKVEVLTLLTPEVRRKIHAVCDNGQNMRINDLGVHQEFRRVLNPLQVENILSKQLEVARVLRSTRADQAIVLEEAASAHVSQHSEAASTR